MDLAHVKNKRPGTGIPGRSLDDPSVTDQNGITVSIHTTPLPEPPKPEPSEPGTLFHQFIRVGCSLYLGRIRETSAAEQWLPANIMAANAVLQEAANYDQE